MQLILRVVSYDGLPPAVAALVQVGDQDCVIGRHPDCQLELPDPECLVSGRHAVISRHGGGFAITDLNSTNGTFLNDAGEPIAPSAPVKLNQGDKIALGSYVLSVSISAEGEPIPADPFAADEPGAIPGMPDPLTSPDIMDLLGAEAGPQASPEVPHREPPPRSIERPQPSVENIHFTIPQTSTDEQSEDRDADAAAWPAEPTQPSKQPGAMQSPAAIPDDYDLLSDVFTGAQDSYACSPAEDTPALTPTAETTARVPDDAVEDAAVRPTPGETPVANVEKTSGDPRDGASDVPSAWTAEVPVDAAGSCAGPAAGARGTEPSADLAAFLDGLGVSRPPATDDSEALLRLAGQLLRAMTEGLLAVMMARASFKSELRLEVTTIRSRDNNPFQFCVDADDALQRLLQPHSRGFLDPPAAVHKTFDDIQAHQMAMISGLRAAMRALLTRFQPEQLEQHFERQSHLDKLLPMARKSKCWDLFVSTFEQVADDAAEDFLRLFGDAFNQAYEDQVRRLNAAQRRDSV